MDMGLENSEYVLTMKENKCILNGITDLRVVYHPNPDKPEKFIL